MDKYLIPKIEDLFSELAGGKLFTKLDMSQAYQQLVLDEELREYVVVRYKCLPFAAPGIFQRVMESIISMI